MRMMLLSVAATAATVGAAAPASAERWSDPGFLAAANVVVHRGGSGQLRGSAVSAADTIFRDGSAGGQHGRRHRRDGDDGFFAWYYPQDFDGNRSFDPDKFNDWWHERTWRSYPRWTQNNQACERVYWTGAGWRC